METITALFSALGLSTAAGLNAYIPLLVVGLLARYTDLIHLSAPYDALTNPWVLLVLALIALVDFIGDKIPAVDHALHAVGVVIHPIAGAIVALAANNALGGANPTLLAVAGLVFALGAHGARAAARPVATATTAGVANPVVSFGEDLISLVMSLLSVVVPIIGFGLALLFGLVIFGFIRRWRNRRAARAT